MRGYRPYSMAPYTRYGVEIDSIATSNQKFYYVQARESKRMDDGKLYPTLRFGSALGCGRLKSREMPEPARTEYLEVAHEDAAKFIECYGSVEEALIAARLQLTTRWAPSFFGSNESQTELEWCLWFAAILKEEAAKMTAATVAP